MFMNIEIERLRRRIRKEELAATLNVPVEMLNAWIREREGIPASKLCALSRLLDCTADYLLKEGR